MKISRNRAAAAAVAVLLAGAAWLPATGQDRPESILPPGFGEPVQPAPTPTPAPGVTPVPGAPAAPAPSGVAPVDQPTPSPTPTATPTPIDLSAYELPASARRSLAMVGAIGADTGGLDANAFGAGNGRMSGLRWVLLE